MGKGRSFIVDQFYHVYNRGTDKRKIFMDKYDSERFLMLMYLCNGEKPVSTRDITDKMLFSLSLSNFKRGQNLVDIISYCLMPNHFHLVLREKVEGGISKFMQKLISGYSIYFNVRYERSGALFQGKFKSEHIDNNAYFNYIFVYVALNPISIFQSDWKKVGVIDEEEAKKFLREYKYSSYLDYIGIDREEKIILNKNFLPEYLEKFVDFRNFVGEWLKQN